MAAVMPFLNPVLPTQPLLSGSCFFAWLFSTASQRYLHTAGSFALLLLRARDHILPILRFNKCSRLFMAVFKNIELMQQAIDGILNIVYVTVEMKHEHSKISFPQKTFCPPTTLNKN